MIKLNKKNHIIVSINIEQEFFYHSIAIHDRTHADTHTHTHTHTHTQTNIRNRGEIPQLSKEHVICTVWGKTEYFPPEIKKTQACSLSPYQQSAGNSSWCN